MPNLIGQSIGRYHILEPLGEGGMAVVYKAYDTRLECEVAVKVIRADQLAPAVLERALKRFEREAKSVARLTHPNIIKVTDFGEHAGSPYLVMPYLPGGTLKQYLKENGRLDWKRATKLLLPIAEALGYAHERGLIHRDVKPSNILLTDKNTPMLTDFGVAKVLDEEVTQDLTGTSATVGTPEYMAPEQVMSKMVDHRADIYALGVVFFEMVTGRRPYEADTPMAVLVMHSRDPLPRPKALVPDLPDGVERVLLKALAKQPQDRYADMAAFAAALQHLEQEQPSGVPIASTVEAVNINGSDAYATLDQYAEEKTEEQTLKPSVVYPAVARQTQPVAAAQTAPEAYHPGRILAIVGGIAVVALLVIGAVSGWFTPRPAAPAPTSAPVIADTTAPTFTAKPPTATQRPATATSAPSATVENYTIGSTKVSEMDGMTMVYVPAGEFLMGSPEGEGDDDEHPQHTVYLDAYWIDQTEVTNAMYARCVADGDCTEPVSRRSYTRDSYYGNLQFDNYPVIYVDWYQAVAYCRWAGRRLPTEAQWEKAARGTDGRTYPWGDETPAGNLVNFNGEVDTAPVGSYPDGISLYGALDMAGNVWERAADWYDENYYQNSPSSNPKGPSNGDFRVLRGGSWINNENDFRSANRLRYVTQDSYGDYFGFRCVLP